jgi:cellobiose-specific phosphotransferase system component IIA
MKDRKAAQKTQRGGTKEVGDFLKDTREVLGKAHAEAVKKVQLDSRSYNDVKWVMYLCHTLDY